jgi:hypothetical protein
MTDFIDYLLTTKIDDWLQIWLLLTDFKLIFKLTYWLQILMNDFKLMTDYKLTYWLNIDEWLQIDLLTTNWW